MIRIDPKKVLNWHAENKERSLHGRYITYEDIDPLLKKAESKKIGSSVNGNSICNVTFGSGNINILVWSQMHGNETTGTKALFDLFKFFQDSSIYPELTTQILERCTLIFIPILNPDGAEVYTRVNANDIDLNRDAVAVSQPESRILRTLLEEIEPEYCFNLHDQRTIFTVGDTKKTATLSFLAPSVDEKRTITEGRKETMRVIVSMNELMQQIIPGNVGRYTDEFYPLATGDNFQKLGFNTILIEAGHFKNDYAREKVRAFNFIAILQGLNYISAKDSIVAHKRYFDIPNNSEDYVDKIFKNVYFKSLNKRVDVGILYKEVLENSTIIFEPSIKFIGESFNYNADIVEDKSDLFIQDEDQLNRFLKKIC